MKTLLPALAAIAFGVAVSAPAEDPSAMPPPSAEPAPAVEASDSAVVPAAERGRPRRGPRRGNPGAGFGKGSGNPLGFLVPLLQKPDMAAKIGLSEEKASALAATFTDLDAQLKAANEKLPATFKAQADALSAETVDEEAVLAAVNAVWDLRREIAVLQTRKLIAIRTALDADQIRKARRLLREERRQFGADCGEPRGPGKMGRPGGKGGPRPCGCPGPQEAGVPESAPEAPPAAAEAEAPRP